MGRQGSPESYKTVSDSEASDFAPSPPRKKAKISASRSVKAGPSRKSKAGKVDKVEVVDIEDLGASVHRPHGSEYHSVEDVIRVQGELLSWFEEIREKRGMPWRKRYDPDASLEEKGQRAYEIWVSEVMLQQTQVATVIDYWRRWMERWPTIADLAKADIEEVNAAWRGLGYYRRARSLLKGAQTVMGHKKYNGRLPKDPSDLEKEVDGVGRYTAGAISSMAYGVRAPIVDGNVHRLLTRLLAVHATQTAPATIKFLWQAAEELVEALPPQKGVAGDWNQALMELGSQVCKPVAPDCPSCPLRAGCKAHAELSKPLPAPTKDAKQCKLCEPISGTGDCIPSVTVFPMKKEKKVSREENEVVCVVEWKGANTDRRWLFTKRPEKGLLAGLFQPPTTPIAADSTSSSRLKTSLSTVQALLKVDKPLDLAAMSTHRDVGSIQHIFSHINMTYHITHLTLSTDDLPTATGAVWLNADGVESANVGTGVKKVWSEVYGSWGSFDASSGSSASKMAKKGNGAKAKTLRVVAKPAGRTGIGSGVVDAGTATAKVVKKVMMPAMPVKASKA